MIRGLRPPALLLLFLALVGIRSLIPWHAVAWRMPLPQVVIDAAGWSGSRVYVLDARTAVEQRLWPVISMTAWDDGLRRVIEDQAVYATIVIIADNVPRAQAAAIVARLRQDLDQQDVHVLAGGSGAVPPTYRWVPP